MPEVICVPGYSVWLRLFCCCCIYCCHIVYAALLTTTTTTVTLRHKHLPSLPPPVPRTSLYVYVEWNKKEKKKPNKLLKAKIGSSQKPRCEGLTEQKKNKPRRETEETETALTGPERILLLPWEQPGWGERGAQGGWRWWDATGCRIRRRGGMELKVTVLYARFA